MLTEDRILDQPTASEFTMVSVGGNYGEEIDEAETTAVQTPSEGVLVGESEEAAAERGEGAGIGMKSRESWRSEGRLGGSIEMQRPAGMSRRSVSRQSE